MADLRAMRGSVEVFAAEVGWPLAPFQADALRFDTRVTTIVAGRQLGKSRALAVSALWAAFRRPEQRSLIVSASDDAARRVLSEVRRIVTGSDLLRGSVVDEQASLVRLSNGSEVRSVAASERAVRGWSADFLGIDEAGLLPAALITEAAMPTTTARPDALILMVGTAGLAAGPFFDLRRLGEVGSEYARAFRWVARVAGGDADAPWVSASAIETDRATMHPRRFSAEHLAIDAGAADAFLAPAVIESSTLDYMADELGSMQGPAQSLLGVDWGASVNRSAAVAIGRLAVLGEPVFAVRAVRRWPAGWPLHAVADEIAASPGHLAAISSEVNGLGSAATEILWRAIQRRPYDAGGGRPAPTVAVVEDGWDPFAPEPRPRRRRSGFVTQRRKVVTSAGLKSGSYGALALLLGQGRLLLPASARELLSELRLLKVDYTQQGTERIEASAGDDDLCDAFMLAAAPFRRQDGAWSTVLGELAQRRDLPTVGGGSGEGVAGPDGLVIPRSPVWISVAGAEVTRPDVGERVAQGFASAGLREQVRQAIEQQQEGVTDE